MNDKLLKITQRLAEKKAREDAIKLKYKDKEKIKPLTQGERIARIEELLNIL